MGLVGRPYISIYEISNNVDIYKQRTMDVLLEGSYT